MGLYIGALLVVLPTVWTVTDKTIANPEFDHEVNEKLGSESLSIKT